MPYSDPEKQREANRRSYAKHREKRVEAKRREREERPEVILEQKRQSSKRPEVRDRKNAYMKVYMRKWRFVNPSVRLEIERRYIESHRPQIREKNRRRAALRRGAEGYCSLTQLQARIDYYGGLCWICGDPMEAIDHVKPLSKGGTEWPANLRPICTSCNSKKRDLWPFLTAA